MSVSATSAVIVICHQPLRSSSRIARLTLRGSKPVSAASVSIRVTATCYAVHVPIEQNKAGGERAGREDVGAHHRIIKIEPGYQGVGRGCWPPQSCLASRFDGKRVSAIF